jgi:phage baseplate assembly protein V
MDLSNLYGRMLSMIGVGRVTASQAAASSGARGLQVRFDETEAHDGLPVVQQYGVASRPQDGADAIVIFPGGDRSRGIVIAVNDRRYQIDLSPGEVALHDDIGQRVKLSRSGIILESPNVSTTGNLSVATGASGSFATAGGQTVTVQDGIITNIF